MKAVVALGNPGERYRDTRHNVGWWLADRLVAAWSFPPFAAGRRLALSEGRRGGRAVRLAKPLTYVNRSGPAVAELTEDDDAHPSSDLLVLVDDVALDPGRIRVRAGGSSGGHNGLASVEEALGSREWARLRIGVGSPTDDRIDLADWVLAAPSDAEEEAILATFDRAVGAVECWLEDGVEAAMNRYN